MRKLLAIDPDREIKLVQTPGGRIGFVKVRDKKMKRITVRYVDARDDEDEVTIDEKLPGLRFIVLRAREVFRREAGEGRYSLTAGAAKVARDGRGSITAVAAKAAHKSGTRGAGAKPSGRGRQSRGTQRSLRA